MDNPTGIGLTAMHPQRRSTERTDFAFNDGQNSVSSEKKGQTYTLTTEKSNSLSDLASVDFKGESKLVHSDTTVTTFEGNNGVLYRDDGTLVLQPAPSPDPKDPLRLPLMRKIVGVSCLCFFGVSNNEAMSLLYVEDTC